jgi:hypothetical protein
MLAALVTIRVTAIMFPSKHGAEVWVKMSGIPGGDTTAVADDEFARALSGQEEPDQHVDRSPKRQRKQDPAGDAAGRPQIVIDIDRLFAGHIRGRR